MPNPKFTDLLPVIFAIFIAIAVIALIKWGLVPTSGQGTGGLADIWQLEVFVISSLLTAFIISEVLEIVQRIIGRGSRSVSRHEPARISPMLLVKSFGASVAIYLAASTWMSNLVAA